MSIPYIQHHELIPYILSSSSSSSPPTAIIIDVRDEDYRGGNIKGALNCPSQNFPSYIPTIVSKSTSHALDTLSKSKDDSKDDTNSNNTNPVTPTIPLVVFHCMQSQVRGPKMSRYFLHYIDEKLSEFKKNPNDKSELESKCFTELKKNIRVLSGGFGGFIDFMKGVWLSEPKEARGKENSFKLENFISNYQQRVWGTDFSIPPEDDEDEEQPADSDEQDEEHEEQGGKKI